MASAVHPGPAVAAHFSGRPSPSWPGLATGVLDLLREAVLVLGRDAHLLGSNRVADALLGEGDGLALARGVRRRFDARRDARALPGHRTRRAR